MPRSTRSKGNEGEDIAAKWLQDRGYTILERNFRCPEGEVDIIGYMTSVIVFVEVKLRFSGGPETLMNSINPRKQLRILKCAERFLHLDSRWEGWHVRFDVIFVEPPRRVRHFPGAFTENGFL